jgi:hypothetical protein
MSTAKRGYGHIKPLINYHSQTAPAPVTTVVMEISGMSVNENPPYYAAGAVQKKHAFLEEEDAGVYSGHHGGIVHKAYQHGSEVGGYGTLHHDGAMQKVHAYGTVVGGYALRDGAAAGGVQAQTTPYRPYGNLYQIVGAGSHQGGSGALTHQYKMEEDSEDESDSEEEELAYGGTGGAQHYRGYKQEEKHDSVVQKHGYSEDQPGGEVGGYDAIRHHNMVEKRGYGWQKAYQPGSGYDALHQDSTVQNKHGYGEQKAYHQGLGDHKFQIHKSCLMPYVLIWKPRGRRRWWL